MEYFYFYIFYTSAFLFYVADAAKILGIFPMPAKSHFTCNNAIMKSLMEAGHEVTVITSFAEQASAENYSAIIDVSNKEVNFVGHSKFSDFITQNPFKMINLGIEVEKPLCSKILSMAEIKKILNSNEKLYDVVFVEILFLHKCFLPVAEKMDVPVIGTVTLRTWLYADNLIYNPNHPAYIPFELVTQKWKLNSLLGRIINVGNSIAVTWYTNYVFPRVYRQFHQDHIDQLGSLGKYMDIEPSLIFYNNHATLLPRPMNPNAIDIGGIHMKEAKPLPDNIENFINGADHGVILFSLGSVVRAASLDLKQYNAFREAFAEIPQRVIWKFEEKLENLSNNVMVLEWLPQRDILEHRNVIAFISHCGLGGTNEAIYTATPVVACPLFCDQPDNAEMLENLGVAVYLDINYITKENILNALNEIINNTRYYDNMQKLSKEFKDRPMTPQQSIVYWTEYVIRHNGAPRLKSVASRLNWVHYFLVDVLFVAGLILGIFAYLIYRIFKIFRLYLIKTMKTFEKLENKKL